MLRLKMKQKMKNDELLFDLLFGLGENIKTESWDNLVLNVKRWPHPESDGLDLISASESEGRCWTHLSSYCLP